MQVSSGPIPLFVQLPGGVEPQFLLAEVLYVGQVIDAIIAKFKHSFSGVDPSNVRLDKLDGGCRTLLYPTQTLSEAGINAGSTLAVVIVGQGVCRRRLKHRHAIAHHSVCFCS